MKMKVNIPILIYNKSTTEVLVLWGCSQINHIMIMIWHIVFNILYFSSVDKSFQYGNEYT